ncbi:hypothetical protein CEK26_009439 [Fusarium fujikuroi]|nr:uncharacterized protein LW94_9713 [Fusarium fujikuroi]QGI65489.1 hypothetical protein CEK27_009460 [Fusarium fujikuroi]QGI96370.1 hypothetical protein CEK26_009439 [Fusarium fujikuroi]SCO17815.1 uncharacterized protein FFE2_13931 [Fusarium fujikuroi]SCO50076.1 uncharacterized protein FFMR_10056 [Fusarium fujikuroi]
MASPFPEANIDKAAREAEYQALWQVCDRATRKPEYIYGDERLKRSFLQDTCDALMRKRQKLGKVPCGTDISAMVTLHLQREVAGRLLAGARMAAPAPAPSPMPYAGNSPAFNPPQSVYAANPDPFNGNPGPYNGNPAPYNIAQAPLPIPQPRARASPPDFDFAIPDTNEDLRQDMERVINTLRQYAQRIATLEKTVAKITREREMYKAGTIDMMNTDMKKSASVSPGLFNYPVEGIEGLSAAAYPHPGPLTPRSQTQGGDEEGDGMYQHGN